MPARKNKKRELHPTGRLLKELRKASGYTQAEIQAVLGFKADSAVSKLESRDFIPDIQRLKKLLHLLRPNAAQEQEILAYFEYTRADLEIDFEPARPVRHHPEQHPLLNLLQQLFYLYTYQKNYQQVLLLLEEHYQAPLNLPEQAQHLSTLLEQIVQAIFSARRLLAQGTLEQRLEDLRDAQQQVNIALSLLDMLTTSQPLPYPLPAFVGQLRLHLLLCAHSSLFRQLNLRQQRGETLEKSQGLFDLLRQQQLPALLSTLQELEQLLPQAESQSMQHMYLFVLREQLHLLTNAIDRRDEEKLHELFSRTEGQALGEALALAFKADPACFAQLYQRIFALQAADKTLWQELNQQYRQVLKAHQRFHNWDAESPELMRAVLNTFLGFTTNQARLGQIETAEVFLDALYLRLNLSDTRYHWHTNSAYVAAMAYLHSTRLEDKVPSQEATEHFKQFCEQLLRAFEYLEQSALLDPNRYLYYTFQEELVFMTALLHAHHHQLALPEALYARAQSAGLLK